MPFQNDVSFCRCSIWDFRLFLASKSSDISSNKSSKWRFAWQFSQTLTFTSRGQLTQAQIPTNGFKPNLGLITKPIRFGEVWIRSPSSKGKSELRGGP